MRPRGDAGRWGARKAYPAGLILISLLVVAGACGNRGARTDAGDPGVVRTEAVRPAAAVHVRGRIADDSLTIEPVLGTRAEGGRPPSGDGAHRLRGLDHAGAPLFEVRFDGVPVADATDSEQHFQFVIDVGPGGALGLARIELFAADGRQAFRQARLSATELTDTLAAAGTFDVEHLDGGRVRVRWDATLFPLVMAQDPETGHVLAVARNGEFTASMANRPVDLIVSEGVRSGARRILVP